MDPLERNALSVSWSYTDSIFLVSCVCFSFFLVVVIIFAQKWLQSVKSKMASVKLDSSDAKVLMGISNFLDNEIGEVDFSDTNCDIEKQEKKTHFDRYQAKAIQILKAQKGGRGNFKVLHQSLKILMWNEITNLLVSSPEIKTRNFEEAFHLEVKRRLIHSPEDMAGASVAFLLESIFNEVWRASTHFSMNFKNCDTKPEKEENNTNIHLKRFKKCFQTVKNICSSIVLPAAIILWDFIMDWVILKKFFEIGIQFVNEHEMFSKNLGVLLISSQALMIFILLLSLTILFLDDPVKSLLYNYRLLKKMTSESFNTSDKVDIDMKKIMRRSNLSRHESSFESFTMFVFQWGIYLAIIKIVAPFASHNKQILPDNEYAKSEHEYRMPEYRDRMPEYRDRMPEYYDDPENQPFPVYLDSPPVYAYDPPVSADDPPVYEDDPLLYEYDPPVYSDDPPVYSDDNKTTNFPTTTTITTTTTTTTTTATSTIQTLTDYEDLEKQVDLNYDLILSGVSGLLSLSLAQVKSHQLAHEYLTCRMFSPEFFLYFFASLCNTISFLCLSASFIYRYLELGLTLAGQWPSIPSLGSVISIFTFILVFLLSFLAPQLCRRLTVKICGDEFIKKEGFTFFHNQHFLPTSQILSVSYNLWTSPRLWVLLIQQSLAYLYFLVLLCFSFSIQACLVLSKESVKQVEVSQEIASQTLVILKLQVFSIPDWTIFQLVFTILIPLGYFLSYIFIALYYWRLYFFFGKVHVQAVYKEKDESSEEVNKSFWMTCKTWLDETPTREFVQWNYNLTEDIEHVNINA